MPTKTITIDNWRMSRLTGEFLDEETETRYFKEEVRSATGYLRLILGMLGLLFLSFAIPDWFVLQSKTVFYVLLAIRISFFVFMLLLGVFIHTIRSVSVYLVFITWGMILCVTLFIATFLLYDAADFLIQSFGLMVILSAFYLVPNRFVNQLMVSSLSIAVFLNLAWMTLDHLSTMELTAVAVYLTLTVCISSIAAIRTSIYKRRQFMTTRQLRTQVVTDSLTQLYNRQKFSDELLREIRRSDRVHMPLCVVMMDLDNFKLINDRFGHPCGDRLLVELADKLQNAVRVTDVLARWGGEEFILLLPATSLKQGIEFTNRLKTVVEDIRMEGVELEDSTVYADSSKDSSSSATPCHSIAIAITCSFGITERQKDDTVTSLLLRVDKLLYQAKAAGKNRVIAG